jgi:DNA-binding NtrC family response regulator
VHVLIIDDEPAIRQILQAVVKRGGYTVDTASNVAEAAAKLVRGDVDVALCDIHMPDGNGLELVRSMRESDIDTQFIMVTAFASVETAVQALKAGATDYIIKPVNNEELLHRLSQIDAVRGLQEENKTLRKLIVGGKSSYYRFASTAMLEVDRLISKVAATDSTVLVSGESGTGKGVVARQLHEQSNRGAGVFMPVNCGAIPENLLESEFFGHVKGAFTGADRPRKGLFLQADKGTLFLDEIGELPLHMQAKLLHAIEDKGVRPVGSEEVKKVDARIVAATNRNLEAMVREGKFREDLFFRLSMFQIHIPPLRERRGDIAGLIRFVLAGLGSAQGRVMSIDPEAEEILLRHEWPGNVRQLENIINRACILSDGGRISIQDLPADMTRQSDSLGASSAAPSSQQGGLRERMRKYEADIIAQEISRAGGDRRVAAEALEVGLSTLYRKLEELEAFGLIKNG